MKKLLTSLLTGADEDTANEGIAVVVHAASRNPELARYIVELIDQELPRAEEQVYPGPAKGIWLDALVPPSHQARGDRAGN